MKIALLMTGHARTFANAFPSQYDYILKPYRPDVFISTWKTLDHFVKNYSTDDKDTPNYIGELYRAKFCEIEDQNNVKFPFDVPAEYDGPLHSLQPLWYKLKRVNEMRNEYERHNNIKYDIIIRCRLDLSFFSELKIEALTGRSLRVPKYGYRPSRKFNDQFSYGTSDAMNAYCGMYDYLCEYTLKNKCFPPGRNEIILHDYLVNQNLDINMTDVSFYINRENDKLTNWEKRRFGISDEMLKRAKSWN